AEDSEGTHEIRRKNGVKGRNAKAVARKEIAGSHGVRHRSGSSRSGQASVRTPTAAGAAFGASGSTASSGGQKIASMVRAALFHARSATPKGMGRAGGHTASWRTATGPRHVLRQPAGKNAMSPGPSRHSSPFSLVMNTSPEMMCTVSSTMYCQLNRPAVHDQAMTEEAPSWLRASWRERASGVPERIQLAGMGAGARSPTAGLAMTEDCDMRPPERVSPKC